MHSRAFTLLEMVLASALAAFVVLAALGMFDFLYRDDYILAQRFTQRQDLSRAHGALRRAFQTMVAAPPTPEQSAADQPQRSELEEEMFGDESLRAQMGFDDDGSSAGPRPYFYIGPVDTRRIDKNIHTGDTAWRIEVLLTQPPTALSPSANGPIRGAFEAVEDGRNWRLQWTPINPVAEPISLVEDLAYCFMEVASPDNQFTDLLRAQEQREFPRSIHIQLGTRDGAEADWLFEPGVTIGDSQ